MTLLEGGASAIHSPSNASVGFAHAAWLKKSVAKIRDKSGNSFMDLAFIIEVQIISVDSLTGKSHLFSFVQAVTGTAKIAQL